MTIHTDYSMELSTIGQVVDEACFTFSITLPGNHPNIGKAAVQLSDAEGELSIVDLIRILELLK